LRWAGLSETGMLQDLLSGRVSVVPLLEMENSTGEAHVYID